MTKKILLVEDNEAENKALSGELQVAGYSVMSETNGADALLKALSEHPDLVILDIMLPGMDGLRILENLRKDDWGKKVPVFMLTNLDTNDTMLQKILALEPKYYFIKQNMKLDEIVAKVEECV